MTSPGALTNLSATGLGASASAGKGALRFTPDRDSAANGDDFLSKFNDLKKESEPRKGAEKAARKDAERTEKADQPESRKARNEPESTAIELATGQIDPAIGGRPLPADGQELPAEPLSENPTLAAAPSAPPAPTAPLGSTEVSAEGAMASADGARAAGDWAQRLRDTAALTQRETAQLEARAMEKFSAEGRGDERLLGRMQSNQPTAKLADIPFPTVNAGNTTVPGLSNPALAGLHATDASPAVSTTATTPNAAPTGPAGTQGLQQTLNMAGNENGWARNLEGQLRQMIQHGPREMTLRLNPAELGNLQIRVNMEKDVASLAVTSQHAAVKEMIEATLPQLRQNMAAQGLNLGEVEVDVNEQLADQSAFGNAFGEHRESGGETPRRGLGGIDLNGIDETALQRAVERVERETPTGIDYFV